MTSHFETLAQKALSAHNEGIWHPKGKKSNDPETRRDNLEEGRSLGTPFAIDRERISLCKAFRRLKHKTQVFWAPRNDHFRTRLTHTIEVAHTARLLSFYLGLNMDLAAAIAYGHDVGHPPFGHGGERALQSWIDSWIKSQKALPKKKRSPDYKEVGDDYTFDHHKWAVKLLQKHEERPFADVPGGRGLNLTRLVCDGIENPHVDNATSIEAQVVGVADDLTWVNHDQEDFKEAHLDMPPSVFEAVRELGSTRHKRVERAIEGIVNASWEDQTCIRIPETITAAIKNIRAAQMEVYQKDERWSRKEEGATTIITKLMDFYMTAEGREIETIIAKLTRTGVGGGAPEEVAFVRRWHDEGEPRIAAAVEQIAKMSDTFALDLYRYIYSPETLDYYY